MHCYAADHALHMCSWTGVVAYLTEPFAGACLPPPLSSSPHHASPSSACHLNDEYDPMYLVTGCAQSEATWYAKCPSLCPQIHAMSGTQVRGSEACRHCREYLIDSKGRAAEVGNEARHLLAQSCLNVQTILVIPDCGNRQHLSTSCSRSL